MTTDQTALVLVHGAWHGPESWDRVERLLRDAGCQVVVVDLPSSGLSAERLGSFTDDLRAVADACSSIKSLLTLVGHSYGATVASVGASRMPRVGGLVSVAGLLPAVSETATTVILQGRTQNLADAVTVHSEGHLSIRPELAIDVFYAACSEEIAHDAVANLRVQSTDSVRARVDGAGWATVPTTYIVCDGDGAIEPAFQYQHAESRGATIVSITSDHSPMLSAPDVLADALMNAVERG